MGLLRKLFAGDARLCSGIGSSSGGSTLTQQLIKQQVVGDAPTFKRKATEIIDALALERCMSKDDILTTYLNVAPFGRNNRGQNIAGVEEAAQGILEYLLQVDVTSSSFYCGVATKPDCLFSLCTDGDLKSAKDMTLGLNRAKMSFTISYRTGAINKDEYQLYKDYDLKRDFLPADRSSKIRMIIYITLR